MGDGDWSVTHSQISNGETLGSAPGPRLGFKVRVMGWGEGYVVCMRWLRARLRVRVRVIGLCYEGYGLGEGYLRCRGNPTTLKAFGSGTWGVSKGNLG